MKSMPGIRVKEIRKVRIWAIGILLGSFVIAGCNKAHEKATADLGEGATSAAESAPRTRITRTHHATPASAAATHRATPKPAVTAEDSSSTEPRFTVSGQVKFEDGRPAKG